MKIVLENIFMCLVTFWKYYFSPSTTQNSPPRKPPKHHHPHHHNNNKNQNHTEIKIAQRERSVVGFRRSQRLWLWVEGSRFVGDLGFGFTGEVEDWFLGSWVHGAKALGLRQSRRLEVAGDGLSLLPLSLFVCGRDLTLTLSLSLFSGKWYLKVK